MFVYIYIHVFSHAYIFYATFKRDLQLLKRNLKISKRHLMCILKQTFYNSNEMHTFQKKPRWAAVRLRVFICSLLQCDVVCCSVSHCVAMCCSVHNMDLIGQQRELKPKFVMCCSMLHCVAVTCIVLHRVVSCCSVLQHVAVHCSVLQ